MQQTTLPFHYAEENDSTGMTALSGLPAYLDLAAVARLGECQGRRDIRPRGGATVYQLSGGVQRRCPSVTGVVGIP